MDALALARLQFGFTSAFHFIFVPLTLGLSLLIALMESIYVKTNNPTYLRMVKFWGKLFLINFAIGVVTGIALEFQFGMNWAQFSKYVGDIFGAPLAIEATVAFFLESTFIGFWVFSWNKVSKKIHLLSIWLVAIATNLSALWILLANGWMQNPVGYVLNGGRANMVDFMALVTNPNGWLEFFHTVLSGYVLAAFFVMGIAAYHLLRKNALEIFKNSFRIAAIFGLVASVLVAFAGSLSAERAAEIQPAKLAAMEATWDTQSGATYILFAIPNEQNGTNSVVIGIPRLLSFLAFHDPNAVVKGLNDFPKDERPPVTVIFLANRLMIALGTLFLLLAFLAVVLSRKIENRRALLSILKFAIPLPYLAIQLGWIVTEIGRQPWIVNGLLKTTDAVSQSVSSTQVWGSLIGFVLLYGFLGIVGIYLLVRNARKDPDEKFSTVETGLVK